MALSLGFKKDRVFWIGDTPVRVMAVQSEVEFVLRVDGGESFAIDDTAAVEILPDVSVSAGVGSADMARVCITAPKHIKINRTRNYGKA